MWPVPSQAKSDVASQAATWYRDVYFSHWRDTSVLVLEDVAPHYSDPYLRHSIGSFSAKTFPEAEFSALVASEIRRGWVGDDLTSAKAELVNQSTVVLHVRVASKLRDGSSNSHCIWYLVSGSSGRWLITNVAEQVCEQE